ncbi:MAG: hypothetical protein K2F83_01650, partial [Oscillospiraceae bacterium]|nr:hypothetical protein [Oscillospiraceae bacterium]
YHVVRRGKSTYEPNASINESREWTKLDTAVNPVGNDIIRMDTREGFSGRNFIKVTEPLISNKTRYVPVVILEQDGAEANEIIYTDKGNVSASGKPILEATYDENGRANTQVKSYETMVMAKVSTGGGHTLNLRADGSVWAYGLNEYGQLGTNNHEENGGFLAMDDPQEIHTYLWDAEKGEYVRSYKDVLSSDGETIRHIATPTFVDVSAGQDHSLLVDSDGNVWAAGNNDRGQLGLGETVSSMPYFVKVIDTKTTTALGGAKIVAVSAGDGFSLALTSDGRVFAWGDNSHGQLGLHTVGGTVSTPTKLALANVNGVSAGTDHSLFTMYDGSLYAAGNNANGKLGLSGGVAEGDDVGNPTYVPGTQTVVEASAGQDHSLALVYAMTIATWGSNEDGRLGRELKDNALWTDKAEAMDGISWIVDVDAGMDHNMALDYNGLLYSWGNNRDGQLGLGNSTNNLWIDKPEKNLRYLEDANIYIRSISAGGAYSAISDTIGQVYGMGDYTKARYTGANAIVLWQNDTLGDTPIIVGEKGQPSSKHQVLVHVGEDVVVDFILSKRFNLFTEFWRNYPITFSNVNTDIAFNNKSIVLEEGSVWNTGDGDIYVAEKDMKFADLVEENKFVVHGSSYGLTHIVLRAGDQTVVYYVNVIPADTNDSKNIVAPMMAAGYRFTLALRSDGTVWAWGANEYGQLGHTIDPDEPYSLLPTQVNFPGLDEENGEHIVSIAAGDRHALALTNKGRLYAWGDNSTRQLGLRLTWGFTGDQTEPDRLSVPTLVTLSATATGADAKVVKMVAGTNHSAALTESGRVYTWGANDQGQLGINAPLTTRTGTPQLVSGMSKVIDLSDGATADTVRVVRYDGVMWGWGRNNNGQINTISGLPNYTEPVIVRLETEGLERVVGQDADGNDI